MNCKRLLFFHLCSRVTLLQRITQREYNRRWIPKNSSGFRRKGKSILFNHYLTSHCWIRTTCFSGEDDTAVLQKWRGIPKGLCFAPILLVCFLSCFFLLCFCSFIIMTGCQARLDSKKILWLTLFEDLGLQKARQTTVLWGTFGRIQSLRLWGLRQSLIPTTLTCHHKE